MANEHFEPKLVGFLCRWCSYTGADLAGTSRIQYPPNLSPIRVMCSGRVDPTFVIKALASGADGVLIAGCHPGDCHYQEGNYKAMRRYRMLLRMLDAFGIERDRVRLEWISASEGDKFATVVKDLTDKVKALGPLNWSANWEEDGRRLEALESILKEHEEAMEVPR
ncbi:MAG: hydrogenase iron-sulfur subunit [Acidobacteriota bacterium]